MPDKPYGEEVIINIIVGIIVFIVVIGLLVFIILFYQKKRFQHMQQMAEKNKAFSEQLLQSQIEIQEQTFNSISSEIHDNVGQVLSLAKVQLYILDQQSSLDREMLNEAKESLSKAMTDLRNIAKSLNSERIMQTDLFEISEQELCRISKLGIMTTSAKQVGRTSDIDQQKKLIIFRMIQECLQNIIRHSNAANIELLFTYEKETLTIKITDDGNGFDTSAIDQKDGLGLKNLFTRAKLIGGNAEINSTPKKGTTITIISPYE